MSTSYSRLDYRLRINKHIERRLVFDVLSDATSRIGLSRHRYVGLGALWFGDFRLAHRRLGIDEMISFEFKSEAPRSNFNRPYRSITVRDGSTHDELPQLTDVWWNRPAVWWLDYDGTLTPEVVGDIGLVLSKGAPNTVLIVTVNADRNSYRRRDGAPDEKSATAVGVVEQMLGAHCIAPEYEMQRSERGVYMDIDPSTFPEMLADAMVSYMSHEVVAAARVAEGENLEFVPLYQIHHADGADMITVGGALTRTSDAERWRECIDRHPELSAGAGPTYTRLDLVPFTVKEKIALDLCLPYEEERAYLRYARRKGLVMHDNELMKYRKFYRHFPVFAEASL
jgi:hypothetical protein